MDHVPKINTKRDIRCLVLPYVTVEGGSRLRASLAIMQVAVSGSRTCHNATRSYFFFTISYSGFNRKLWFAQLISFLNPHCFSAVSIYAFSATRSSWSLAYVFLSTKEGLKAMFFFTFLMVALFIVHCDIAFHSAVSRSLLKIRAHISQTPPPQTARKKKNGPQVLCSHLIQSSYLYSLEFLQ